MTPAELCHFDHTPATEQGIMQDIAELLARLTDELVKTMEREVRR